MWLRLLISSGEFPVQTVQVPEYTEGSQANSFQFFGSIELDWAATVDSVFTAVPDDPRVRAAVMLISDALPIAVREVEYVPMRGSMSTPARAFCAFCELALREFPTAQDADVPVVARYEAVVAAADRVEAFCEAERHRVVQVAPVAAVATPGGRCVTADISPPGG